MTWKTGTLKIEAANNLLDGLAIVAKHSLGYYEATLINGEVLQHKNNTDLGRLVIDRCIELGLKRKQEEGAIDG